MRKTFWLLVLAGTAAGLGCSLFAALGAGNGDGGTDSGQGSSGTVLRHLPLYSGGQPTMPLGGTASVAPTPLGAGTCPAATPIVCGSSCCPEGSLCVDSKCYGTSVEATCPAQTPVLCVDNGVFSCCAPGSTCDGNTCVLQPTPSGCPTPGMVDCGTYCCAAGGSCSANDTCLDPPSPCDAGVSVTCGSGCCTHDCTNGPGSSLCWDTSPPMKCGSSPSLACGDGCCPSTMGFSCDPASGTCRSVERGGAPTCPDAGFTLCPSGQCAQAFSSCGCDDAGLCTVYGSSLTPPAGEIAATCPQPDASVNVFCPLGASTCVSGTASLDACCPQGAQLCGTTCCSACDPTTGGCACPSPAAEILCGSVCCVSGQEKCVAGACKGICDSDYPIQCGLACCNAAAGCQNDTCVCPANLPTQCGGFCCQAGVDCTLDGQDCGCPSGMVQCPDQNDCCPAPPPATCSAGEISADCPDGTPRCCSPEMICCRDSANNGAIGCEFTGFCE